MINPLSALKVIHEGRTFIQNHEEVLPFIKENFGEEIEEGAILRIQVIRPGAEESTLEIEVKDSDIPLFTSLAELLD